MMSQLSVNMFTKNFFLENSNTIFPEYRDRDFSMGKMVINSANNDECPSSLVAHIDNIVTREGELLSGGNPVYPVPSLYEAPFSTVFQFLDGRNLDNNSHVMRCIGADISYDDIPIMVNLEAPINNFISRLSELLNAAQLESLLGDLIRAFTQLVRFTALPVSLKSKLISDVRVLVSFMRLHYGYDCKD